VVPAEQFVKKADTVAGSYDFYTGRIFFQFENAKFFIGERNNRATLRLGKVNHVITTPMPLFNIDEYKLVQ
jgi:hypothetical protein